MVSVKTKLKHIADIRQMLVLLPHPLTLTDMDLRISEIEHSQLSLHLQKGRKGYLSTQYEK